MTWWLLVLSFVTLLLSVLVVGLLQSHAAMVRALDGLGADFGEHTRPGVGDAAVEPAGDERAATSLVAAEGGAVGMAARDVIGTDVSGNPIAIAVTRVERHTLLAFLSSGCLACHGFWEGLADPRSRAEAVGSRVSVVAVAKGVDSESPAAIAKLAGGNLATVMSNEAWDDYSVPVAPYFVLVDGRTDRVIGEGSAVTFAQLGSMLERAAADAAAARSRAASDLSRRGLLGIAGGVVDHTADSREPDTRAQERST